MSRKRLIMMLGFVFFVIASSELTAGSAKLAGVDSGMRVDRILLNGEIVDDENITFGLSFRVDAEKAGTLPIVSGSVCEKSSKVASSRAFSLFWGGNDQFSIHSDKGRYFLDADKAGKCDVEFDFASRVLKKGVWRESGFSLLPAISRDVEIFCHRKGVELEIPGALQVVKKAAPDGKGVIFTAALPPEGDFKIKWRSHVEKLAAKLVASVSPTIVCTVLPGTVRNFSVFDYKVIQGKLSKLSLKVSNDLSILNVAGDAIRDWRVEKKNKQRFLKVSLSREFDKEYKLSVTSEKVLSKFPCDFSIPRITPVDVLRVDGYLAFGTNKAIKLIVAKTAGLNQVDDRIFPIKKSLFALPAKSLYTYSFSGDKYSLDASADNIMPVFSVDMNHVVEFKDEELQARTILNLDIKDAPLKELLLEFSADLAINRVSGRCVRKDEYELVSGGASSKKLKLLRIPLPPETMGKVELELFFEKNIRGANSLEIPVVRVLKAKSVRGFLLLAASRGLSLTADGILGMKKVHPGSVPFKIPGLLLSYKFKGQKWEGKVDITHEKTSFVSEIFHLSTVGEGAVYGISFFNYRISGAPTDKLVVVLEKGMNNPEFTGADIVDWRKVKENKTQQFWQVNFKEKLFGDYKLLVTYESPLRSGEKSSLLKFGDIFTENATAESGFIVIASKENLKITEKRISSASVMEIEASELPKEYASLVQNPIIKVYKFYRSPHWVDAEVAEFKAKKLVGTVVDYATIYTRVALNGELVTKVECRLKNASRQFLKMKLPEGTKLWNVDIDGVRKRVSESSGEKGVYLIPIPRKKDTEEPLALSVSYARKLDDELGSGTSMRLVAPKFDVDALSVKWKVAVPENYDFTSIESNMMTRQVPRMSGLSGMYSNMLLWWSNFLRSGSLPGFIIFLCAGGALSYSWGRRKLRILVSVVAGVAILFACAMLLSALFKHGIKVPANIAVNRVVFTKLFATTANVAEINIGVENMEAFTFMKIFWFIVMLFPALYFLKTAYKRKSAFFYALASCLMLFALTRWLPASRLFAVLLAFLIPLAFYLSIMVIIFKKSQKARISAAVLIMPLLFLSSGLNAAETSVVLNEAAYDISASNIEVKAVASFAATAKAPGETLLVPAPIGITGKLPDNSDIRIERKGGDYYLRILSAGSYKFKLTLLLPLKKAKDGAFTFPLPLPNSRKNSVRVAVELDNTDIAASDAVSFKTTMKNGKVNASATFVPGSKPVFRLFPLKRQVGTESVRFFANTVSLANFAGGVVEVKHVLDFNIAQGELAKFAVQIPPSMGVTAVSAPDLGAWRYSPATNLLEVFLTRAHHDNLRMLVTTQIANCVLPYEKKIEVLKVVGAGKQHGTIGVSASRGVRIEVGDANEMSPINSDDFATRERRGARKIRKAFRYFSSTAFVNVKAFPVIPEIRLNEKCVVGFEEERTTLISDMALEVSKAGLFSVTIEIPEGFDVDKVTGNSVRHWDEVTKNIKHLIVVHFTKRVLGLTQLHLELMSEKPRRAEMTIPRTKVVDARKLKGTLTINLERGTRMDIREKRGLESAALSLGSASSSRRFSIVRPDWMLKVDFEVASPWIQLDNLQVCKISEGALEFNSVFQYKIKNAGIKRFNVRLPVEAEVPEFLGRDIMSYRKIEDGAWEIELKRKVMGYYRLDVKFRTPIKNMSEVAIHPAKILGVNRQKGYFAIVAEDSLQVKRLNGKGDLSEFDARKIPVTFNSKYLAGAVLCYKTVGTNYSVTLKVERNKAVKLLRAEVKNLALTSLVSEEGNTITNMLVNLVNLGSEHFLTMRLPPNSRVWSVFIDRTNSVSNPGQAVEAAEENGRLLIPLKQKSDRVQKVELVYSTKVATDWSASYQSYVGPEFDLPVNNISWTFYLPEKMEYNGFEGTLKYKERRWIPTPEMNLSEYDRQNSEKKGRKRKMVRQWLSMATSNAKKGNIQVANAAFQNASDFALDDKELREDVQGEWQEAQSQNVLNLFQKRSPRRVGNGMVTLSPQKSGGKHNINQVSGKEMRTVKSISNKMFRQQLAAGSSARPLVFSLPSNGRKVEFTRPLQVRGDTPMRVSFAAERIENGAASGPFTAGVALTLILFLLYKFGAISLKRDA